MGVIYLLASYYDATKLPLVGKSVLPSRYSDRHMERLFLFLYCNHCFLVIIYIGSTFSFGHLYNARSSSGSMSTSWKTKQEKLPRRFASTTPTFIRAALLNGH